MHTPLLICTVVAISTTVLSAICHFTGLDQLDQRNSVEVPLNSIELWVGDVVQFNIIVKTQFCCGPMEIKMPHCFLLVLVTNVSVFDYITAELDLLCLCLHQFLQQHVTPLPLYIL